MKLTLVILVVFIVAIEANPVRRQCECKAVSPDIGLKYHEWDISTCHFCGCNDATIVNCESACKALVEAYAKTGCGKLLKGTKIKYKYEASTCKKGHGTDIITCS